jgi:hypothetical protein
MKPGERAPGFLGNTISKAARDSEVDEMDRLV